MGCFFYAARLLPAPTLLYLAPFPEARMARWPLLAILLASSPQDPPRDVDGLGLRVAPGFKVTLYSGPEIANDIYAMTLDSKGRVVVTSQGWIKVLHDDGHGKEIGRAHV